MDTANLPIILAQCKAYQSLEEITTAIENLIKIQPPTHFNIHVSLPYSFIEPLSKKFESQQITFGAEVFLDADEGSFTTSIAGKLLEKLKAKFVLIGTAQDRNSHSPSSHHLKNKVKAALDAKIHPFVCIGETLHDHQDKISKDVLTTQLQDCLEGFSPEELHNIHIVYNAEWISRTPWEAASPELQDAYHVFHEVVKETLITNDQNHLQLILSVPAYSEELPQLITSLKTPDQQLAGYSLGILGLSSEFLQPLEDKTQTRTPLVSDSQTPTPPVETAETPIVETPASSEETTQNESPQEFESLDIPLEAPSEQEAPPKAPRKSRAKKPPEPSEESSEPIE